MKISWRECSPTETIRPTLYQVGYGMCGCADYEYTVTDDLDTACDMAADEIQRYQELGYEYVRVNASFPSFPDCDTPKGWARVMHGATYGRTAFVCPPDTDHPVYSYVDIVPYVDTDPEYALMADVFAEDQD